MKQHDGANRCALPMPPPFVRQSDGHVCGGERGIRFSLRHMDHPICAHVCEACCALTFNVIVSFADEYRYMLNVPAICNCGCRDTPPLTAGVA